MLRIGIKSVSCEVYLQYWYGTKISDHIGRSELLLRQQNKLGGQHFVRYFNSHQSNKSRGRKHQIWTSQSREKILHFNSCRRMTTISTNNDVKWTLIKAADGTTVPCERSSHGVSYLKGSHSLFVHGGEHIARTPLDDDEATWLGKLTSTGDSTTCSWELIKSDTQPPHRIAHAQATDNDDTVYIFGGRQGITMEERALNDMWSWNEKDGWKEIKYVGDVVPEARSFHKMTSIGNKLYVFGGCGDKHGRLNDLYEFDISTCAWTDLGKSHCLRGRGGPNLVSLDKGTKLAIIAGFAGEETKDGHIYNITQNKWEEEDMSKELTDLRPRSVCIAVSSLTNTAIFGGEVDPSHRGHEGAGGFANDVNIFDPTTGTLLQTIHYNNNNNNNNNNSQWPCIRGWSDGDIDNESIYIFGGLTGDDEKPERLNDLWKLQI